MTGQPNKAASAIHEVMAKVANVNKSSSKNLNYDFVSKDTVIAAVRPHMIAEGLVVYPVEMNDTLQVQIEAANSKVAYRATGTIVFRFQHAPSGDFIDVPIPSEAIDYGDKATNKLLGFAIKNVLLQTFALESGEKDPEEVVLDEPVKTQTTERKAARLDNQWERNIVQKAVELQITEDEYSAVGTLNHSPFKSIPYGDLDMNLGIAFILAHYKVKEKNPKDTPENLWGLTDALWEKNKKELIDLANEKLGG